MRVSASLLRYNSLNRLILETIKDSGGNTAQWYKYTLDTAGNRIKAEEYTGRVTEYEYDDCYRLTKETRIDNSISDVIEYTYDNMYNRLSKSENGVVTEYKYDANNRLIRQGDETLEYDNNGNLLRQFGGDTERTYTYDHSNRLAKVFAVDGNNVVSEEYKYDAEGNRISKITNEVDVTKYIVDSNTEYADVLAELDGEGNVKVVYTHGDEVISQKRGNAISFYLTDGHGNVRMLADESGNITDTYDYDAFGNLTNQTGTTENSYLYCGEQYDAVTGYYYLRARYMDPTSGTFVTMDTYQGAINDPVSLHKYLYANANPVMNIDPSGNFSLGDTSVAQAIQGVISKVQTINYAKIIPKLLLNTAIGGVSGGIDAFLGDKELSEILKEAGIGAACGLILGVFCQFQLVEKFLCTIGYTSLVVGVKESFDNNKPGQACFRAIMCVALAFSIANGSGKSTITQEDNTYFHVTTQQAAEQIQASQELRLGKWETEVFAWTQQPTKSQALNAGIGSKAETVLKFKTNASFKTDTGVKESLQGLAVKTVDGTLYPVEITDVSEVGFKKEWYQFWKK